MKSSDNGSYGAGLLCSYVHFVTEVVCFFLLYRMAGPGLSMWTAVFCYDALAFVPQTFIGKIRDRHPELRLAAIGVGLLACAVVFFSLSPDKMRFLGLFVLCTGNAIIHVDCADITLRAGNTKLAPAAMFVAGGSFGVITGKLLDNAGCSYAAVLFICLTALPFVILAEKEKYNSENSVNPCGEYVRLKKGVCPAVIVTAAFAVVCVRSLMAYGIPTAWNKTVWQTVLLYVFMGFGKAAGGFAVDRFGIKSVSFFSIAVSVPFLLFGNTVMILSLIGVMLFSMTMAVTLGMIVTIMPQNPGFAFGITTVGLFLGSVPALFLKVDSLSVNAAVVSAGSVLCFAFMSAVLPEKNKGDCADEGDI